MNDLKIHVTCQCRQCDGLRGVPNPVYWEVFWPQIEDWEKANPQPPEPHKFANPTWADWWDRRNKLSQMIWSELGYDKELQDTEMDCPTCAGSGRESLQLPLEALARQLGVETGWPA